MRAVAAARAAVMIVTFFDDYAARIKRERDLAGEALVELISTTRAPAKEQLPWLKLARFGEQKSDKGSLRHDANLVEITGVEVDYDGERIGFYEAEKIARDAGLDCIIYTSPSHQPDRPRWRILCLLSCPLPPSERNRLLSWLHGLYSSKTGGQDVFAGESWTLSQSYYYGAVGSGTHHRVVRVDGTPLDRLDTLAATARGKPQTQTAGNNGHGPGGRVDEAALLELVRTGANYHNSAIRLIGHWARQGFSYIEAEARIRGAFEAVDVAQRVQRWCDRVADIPDLLNHVFGREACRTASEGVHLEDFHAYMPMHSYLFAPCCTFWPGSSVDARLPRIPVLDDSGNPVLNGNKPVTISPSAWLDRNRPIEQMTWAPGAPKLIKDRLIADGGWFSRPGITVFNLYRPPKLALGDSADAKRWIDHVYAVYPDDAEHIIYWLAHRVQRPGEKINHALVLGGEQGIGKDSLLEPVKRAIGPWNCQEENPSTILESRFNGYLKAVILRISEARDLGDSNRFRFYDHLKAIIASPPDVLRINEKHIREYYIPNLCGVVITTNHKTDGIYLPEDDRRHFVAWSPRKREDFTDAYWQELWYYYDHEGGDAAVAAYLAELDLTAFNPKAPPPKTPAFWDIISAGLAPEGAEMADIIENLGSPAAVTIGQIINATKNAYGEPNDFGRWLGDRTNRRKIPHRLKKCGYMAVHNPDARDGLWRIEKVRQVIYAKKSLTRDEQRKAAESLASK